MKSKNCYEADIVFTLLDLRKVIGTIDGYPVTITLQLKQVFTEYARETTRHDHIHAHHQLSIQGSAKDVSGQCNEVLDQLETCTLSKEDLVMLKFVWHRWHLNDMRAGCVHQEEVPGNIKDEEWKKRTAAETAKCPAYYKYGEKWLVEPLPYDIVKFVRRFSNL